MLTKTLHTFSLFLLAAAVTIPTVEAATTDAAADLIAVRLEARQLEQEMYTIFNRLNSTDDFDVTCAEEKITGSIITEWNCTAAFMRNANSREASTRFDNPTGGGMISPYENIPQSSKQIAFKNRKKVQQLNDEMMSLARQHNELAAAMIAYNNKRKQLEQLEK